MIAKCALVALLAVVASARTTSELYSGCGCGSESSEIALVSSDSSSESSFGSSFGSSGSSSGPITRNIIAKGKYQVALRNCGPALDTKIPVTTTTVTTPVQERPTIRLPASIPAPRVISHSCTCYKTIVRPRVQQQIISVPSVQRYVETRQNPIFENIQYEAVPVNCESGSSSGSSSSSSGSVELISSGSCSGSSQVQAVEIPSQQYQVVEAQRVEVPRVQVVEAQRVEVPRVQVVEAQRVQVPSQQYQVVEAPRVQVVEAQRVEIPQIQTVQVPRVQVVEAPTFEVPQVQSVEIPRSFSF